MSSATGEILNFAEHIQGGVTVPTIIKKRRLRGRFNMEASRQDCNYRLAADG